MNRDTFYKSLWDWWTPWQKFVWLILMRLGLGRKHSKRVCGVLHRMNIHKKPPARQVAFMHRYVKYWMFDNPKRMQASSRSPFISKRKLEGVVSNANRRSQKEVVPNVPRSNG